jgi:hypothetical protein
VSLFSLDDLPEGPDIRSTVEKLTAADKALQLEGLAALESVRGFTGVVASLSSHHLALRAQHSEPSGGAANASPGPGGLRSSVEPP